jgi:hypothetical protein
VHAFNTPVDLAVTGLVLFELRGRAVNLGVGPPDGEQARFRRGDVEVLIEMATREGMSTDDLLVTASTRREVGAEAYRLFEDNFVALLKPSENEKLKIPGSRLVRVPERIVRWVFEPPEAVLAICEDVYAELHAEAARLIRLLRWLCNQREPAQPLGNAVLYCSLDGSLWDAAPTRQYDPPHLFGLDALLDEEWVGSIAKIWENGEVDEPLARQIYLESYALAEENPRAALVLAVAAAEVALKQFAAGQSDRPSEAWLISAIQSPRLLDLLRDYLPFLTDKRTIDGRAIPKALVTALDKAATDRNHIVHRGEAKETYTPDQMAKFLLAVNDFLYLLDWFGGNDWAFDRLQEETKAAYGAEQR